MTMGPSSAAAPFVEAAMADAPMPRRLIVLVLMRSSAVVVGTLLVYGLLPVREETARVVGIGAVLGLVALGVVFALQLGRISRADRPVIVAIEALALVVTMFVALFASLYVSMSASDPGAFTQPVTKVAGIYFAVTVLGTVGFGDISAVADPARIAVTIQMVLDLILIGVAVKVLGASARRAVEAKVSERLAAAADTAVPTHAAPADGSSSRTTDEEG